MTPAVDDIGQGADELQVYARGLRVNSRPYPLTSNVAPACARRFHSSA
jgi:hypothetical protein